MGTRTIWETGHFGPGFALRLLGSLAGGGHLKQLVALGLLAVLQMDLIEVPCSHPRYALDANGSCKGPSRAMHLMNLRSVLRSIDLAFPLLACGGL